MNYQIILPILHCANLMTILWKNTNLITFSIDGKETTQNTWKNKTNETLSMSLRLWTKEMVHIFRCIENIPSTLREWLYIPNIAKRVAKQDKNGNRKCVWD